MYRYYSIKPSTADAAEFERAQQLIKQLAVACKESMFMVGVTLYDGYVYFTVGIGEEFENELEVAVKSIYPLSTVEGFDEYTEWVDKKLYHAALSQSQHEMLPFVKEEFPKTDPLDLLLEAFKKHSTTSEFASFELWLKPVGKSFKDQLNYLMSTFSGSFSKVESKQLLEQKKLRKKFNAHIDVYTAENPEALKRNLLIYLEQFSVRFGNSLKINEFNEESYSTPNSLELLLDVNEAASLFHLPTSTSPERKVIVAEQRILPVPKEVAQIAKSEDATLFGTSLSTSSVEKIGIKPEDRNLHTYIVGKTGSGKTKLMELLIKSDLENGRGVIYLDPHGDTARNILKYVPKDRVEDVVFADFTSNEFIMTFNPIEVSHGYGEITSENFVEIFKRFFGIEWNPKMEFLLRQVIAALRYKKNATVLDIQKLLTNPKYRQELIPQIDDDAVKNFWSIEFNQFAESYYNQAISPLQTKISHLLSNQLVRRIVSVPKSSFDLKEIIKENKVLIVNLSIGELGEWSTSFIGSMLISKILEIMLGQASLKEEVRQQVNLYIDEFQNFSTESFIRIFSEARKFKLALTLAHQYLGQIPDPIMKAILGNVGSIIAFRLGQSDANFIANEFQPYLKSEDFVQLNSRNFWAKLSVNGKTSVPFSGRTLDLMEPENDCARDVRQKSKMRYAKLRSEVDKLIEGEVEFEKVEEVNTFESPV